MEATAQAQPNIALVKYWGKQASGDNLPAVASLSITLETLWTQTHVRFRDHLDRDLFTLNGDSDPDQRRRVTHCLDLLRARAGITCCAEVDSRNNFPTGAGLASSASGFAALVTATGRALGLELTAAERSALARRCSGSAARSIFGGFVEMPLDADAAGTARQLLSPSAWPLSVLVLVTSLTAKSFGSTDGMEQTARTSDYYAAWVDNANRDFNNARDAVLARDFDAIADISELSCLKMHGLMLSSRPGLVYWNGATVEAIHRIRELRAQGVPVFFTIDAGPQVKAVCPPEYCAQLEQVLGDIPGVVQVIRSGLGAGARISPS